MANGDQNVEVSNPILGSFKVSGQNLNTIFTVFGFIILVLVAWVLWSHHADAKDNEKNFAVVLKESNKVIADALKENNATIVRTLDKMTEEQRKSTDAIREIACLSDPAMRNRQDARDFCKRISRDSR